VKKTIYTILFSLSLISAVAGVGGKTVPPGKDKDGKTPADSTTTNLSPGDIAKRLDSVNLFPAYALYNDWDTEKIHYDKFDIRTLKDSVRKIALNENGDGSYVHPFDGKVTCPFGQCRRYFHYGVDIDLNTGDAVSAAFDGKVRVAKLNSSYGNVVIIRHSNGLETYYAHLSKLLVKSGDAVMAGQIIGLGGNTGYSRGSHLHFEVRYLGQPINPNDLISFTDEKLTSDTLYVSKKSFIYNRNLYSKKNDIHSINNYASKNNNSMKDAGKLVGNEYVVKQGDSLSAIAGRYGTSVSELCKKNGLKTNSILRLGQRIKV